MKLNKTVSFTSGVTNIFFHILTKCNLKCRHCYINKKQHGDITLSLSTIKVWLKEFAKRDNNANLIFLGGEPTLHPELSLAIQEANNLGYSSVTVDTNGYLFNNILSKVRPDQIDYFSFSLDGAKRKTNDAIRGEGSFDKCIEGIKKAVLMGFHASVIYTVNSFNIDEIKMMIPLLNDLNIDRFFIQVLGIRGRSAQNDKKNPANSIIQVSRKKWLRIIPDVAMEIANCGIQVTYPKVYLDCDKIFECAALVSKNYFVFPNGRVYQCPLCEDFPIHSMVFKDGKLIETERINETDLFRLNIAEGCVMNKIIQPDNLYYNEHGDPEYKIACCMLKEEISG